MKYAPYNYCNRVEANEYSEKLGGALNIFKFEDDKLIYTRTGILEESDEIIIPKVSTFTIIEAGVFKPDDNYLSKYEDEVILR